MARSCYIIGINERDPSWRMSGGNRRGKPQMNGCSSTQGSRIVHLSRSILRTALEGKFARDRREGPTRSLLSRSQQTLRTAHRKFPRTEFFARVEEH